MQRREFITLIGGAAAAQADHVRLGHADALAKRPLLAVLGGVKQKEFPLSFMGGMRALGYIEGSNFDVAYRFADGHPPF